MRRNQKDTERGICLGLYTRKKVSRIELEREENSELLLASFQELCPLYNTMNNKSKKNINICRKVEYMEQKVIQRFHSFLNKAVRRKECKLYSMCFCDLTFYNCSLNFRWNIQVKLGKCIYQVNCQILA